MYENLIMHLRACAKDWNYDTYKQAADAIERLNCFNALWQEAAKIAHEREPKWIPLTERCPENQRPVLVYVPPYTDEEEEYTGYVGMAYYTSSAHGGYWCGTDGNVYGAIGMIHEPMAWMPRPEPPEEET